MAVTKENYTGIIDDIIRNYQTKILKNTSTVQEIRIEDNQRAVVRDQVESSLRSQGITYGELTRNVGSFGGTEIILFGKKIRFIYKLKSVSAGSGAAALTRLSESAQCAYAAIAFGLGRSIKKMMSLLQILVDILEHFLQMKILIESQIVYPMIGLNHLFLVQINY